MRFARTLVRDRKGATVVEYGFILALVVLALMVTLIELGTTTSGLWGNVSAKVQAVN
jgi:pilus assembly protein Flp/PilA